MSGVRKVKQTGALISLMSGVKKKGTGWRTGCEKLTVLNVGSLGH
jgi:hypothetical protein